MGRINKAVPIWQDAKKVYSKFLILGPKSSPKQSEISAAKLRLFLAHQYLLQIK